METMNNNISNTDEEKIISEEFSKYFYTIGASYRVHSMPSNDDLVIYKGYLYFVSMDITSVKASSYLTLVDDSTTYGKPTRYSTLPNPKVKRIHICIRKGDLSNSTINNNNSSNNSSDDIITLNKDQCIKLLIKHKNVLKKLSIKDCKGENPCKLNKIWIK